MGSYLKAESAVVMDEMKGATQEIIDGFKSQYDKLSIFARFAEDAFMDAYRNLRDAPDPVDTLMNAIDLADNLQNDVNRCESFE